MNDSPAARAAAIEQAAGLIEAARLRGKGYSWAEIAARLGVTRQAAHQRWGNTAGTRSSVARRRRHR